MGKLCIVALLCIEFCVLTTASAKYFFIKNTKTHSDEHCPTLAFLWLLVAGVDAGVLALVADCGRSLLVQTADGWSLCACVCLYTSFSHYSSFFITLYKLVDQIK